MNKKINSVLIAFVATTIAASVINVATGLSEIWRANPEWMREVNILTWTTVGAVIYHYYEKKYD